MQTSAEHAVLAEMRNNRLLVQSESGNEFRELDILRF